MTATIISMTTTTITYTINSITSPTKMAQDGYYNYTGDLIVNFAIEVSPSTYVISTLPNTIYMPPPGLPFPQFTMPLNSYPGYTTTLTPGEYDVQINNPPPTNYPQAPSNKYIYALGIQITSPKITLTIEE